MLHSTGISIHLMLRFYRWRSSRVLYRMEFQYISCYGSIESGAVQESRHNNFNTSHVTVLWKIRNCNYKIWFISIHLMLRFYFLKEVNPIAYEKFQYISCYGSMMEQKYVIYKILYFNTSHVTVLCWSRRYDVEDFWFQYISCYGSITYSFRRGRMLLDFNTSHVTVLCRLCGCRKDI